MKHLVAKLPPAKRRRPRRRRLKSLAFAPTLLTLGNLLCGFAAIHFALRAMYDLGAGVPATPTPPLHQSLMERTLPPFLSVGAGLVLVGVALDFLDGLLARVTRSTTNFGGQLDSLADVVSFGVAPAILMVAFMTQELAAESIVPSPVSEHIMGRAAWVAAAIYLAFTAVRLARFNVEHARADFDYRTFHGMPSPAAAGVLMAIILLPEVELGNLGRSIVVYTMPLVTLVIAFLMISRISYRRFHRAYFLGRRPFSHVITAVFLLAMCWLVKSAALLLIVLWYAASGPTFLLARRLRERQGHNESLAAEQRRADTEAGRRRA